MTITQSNQTLFVGSKPDWIIETDWKRYAQECKSIDADAILYEKQVFQPQHARFFRVLRRFNSLGDVQELSTLEFDFDQSYQKFQLHSLTLFRERNL